MPASIQHIFRLVSSFHSGFCFLGLRYDLLNPLFSSCVLVIRLLAMRYYLSSHPTLTRFLVPPGSSTSVNKMGVFPQLPLHLPDFNTDHFIQTSAVI